MRAEILHIMSVGDEHLDEMLLQQKSCVVGADSDS
jgi:hypothetical protein